MTKEDIQKYQKEYYEANKDKITDMQKEYYESNKDKRKEYLEANKDKIRDIKKAYREANKDKIRNTRNKWHVNSYNNNPLFNLSHRIRSMISKSLKKQKYKKISRTAEILGCSFEVFKVHIEEQFPRNMNWDNKHLWHYDHIKPLASATSEGEMLRLNHYTNFQPLWEEDNLEKSDNPNWIKCPIKYAK